MIVKRRVNARRGRRQEFSYSAMIWISDGKGRRQLWGGTFPTLSEAKGTERRLLLDRDAGADLKPSRLTVAELCEQYVAEKRNKVKASTLQRSEELLKLLLPLIGSIKANSLKPSQISEAYNILLKRLSKRTVLHAHWQLHGALELAVTWGQLSVNAAGRVSAPKPEAFEGRAVDADELARLLDVVQSKPLAALIIVAIDSGARQGELLALRWSDVNLDAGLLHIGRSVRRLKGGFVFSDPKTKRSRRTVEISPPTAAALMTHRRQQIERRMKAGNLWANLDLVFPTGVGTPIEGNRVSMAFGKLATEAGLEGLRFHDLRHSSVSLLLQSGEPMADVSRRAGHATINVTVDTYGHGLGAGGSLGDDDGKYLEARSGGRRKRMVSKWLANAKTSLGRGRQWRQNWPF